TASQIYEWARIKGEILTGNEMGSKIIKEQIRGITKAARRGLFVKVNSILIPSINERDIIELAKRISKAGASLQNIIPLVPNDSLVSMKPPLKKELEMLRSHAAEYIDQFRYCKQCRSDVVGIPGCDVIL
ncbi:MAG: hypothetical protein ACFFEE_02290, partial [Candidatus Thorarchaeota archaeon]